MAHGAIRGLPPLLSRSLSLSLESRSNCPNCPNCPLSLALSLSLSLPMAADALGRILGGRLAALLELPLVDLLRRPEDLRGAHLWGEEGAVVSTWAPW